MTTPIEHFDLLIVGAGLSGIGAGVHVQRHCPNKRYAILEGRGASGGTWDLFRYPGIRSDSDMYTLGYAFRPWTEAKAIADGPSILKYVRDTARDYGVEQHIRYGHRVRRAAWSSAESRWIVTVQRDAEEMTFTCNFLFMCSGYYRYESGYTPAFPGIEQFAGRVVHPQQWTADIDTAAKRVVVIGSGATAVTLVPELAKTAAHVTMLQRSPTYVVSRPAVDAIADKLRRWLPAQLAYDLVRWKNVLYGMYIFKLCRAKPALVKMKLLKLVRAELGPQYDVATHFTPRYNPWEQRMCLVPDSDLFASLKAGTSSVVTEQIETFTPTGIKLKSGAELPADIVVTATGLQLEVLGGMQVEIDGRPIDLAQGMVYKGMMYSGVPNLAFAFGYTNASWTLKADLTCEFVCRLLKHMDKTGTTNCTPHTPDASVSPVPWVDFSSGYFQRAADKMPKQGSKPPWRLHQNYALDLLTLRFSRLEDGVLGFGR